MLPRISLRRSFLYLLGVTCFLFLAVNVHQRELELWARSMLAADMAPPHSAAGSRGSAGAQASGRIIAENTNRLGEVADEQQLGGKEQDDVEEDQVQFRHVILIATCVTSGEEDSEWKKVCL
jgi:hypothetical protein